MNATSYQLDVDPFISEMRVHEYVTEASALGLPPGQVARSLKTKLGNGQPFVLLRVDDAGTAHYRQLLGCLTLAVLND